MTQRMRALVIEDDEATRAVFAQALSEEAVDATCVSHDALPEPDGYALVLTDLPWQLRYSSERSLSWVTMLRDRYAVPIVVFTGRAEAAADGALSASARVFLKPDGVGELLDQFRALAGDGSRS